MQENNSPVRDGFGMGMDLLKIKFIACIPNPPDTIAHFSSSGFDNLFANTWNKKKKSVASFAHFWIFPEHKAQTFLTKGHSHSKCPTNSSCWKHSSQRAFTFTLLRCKLSLIGRILEQAHQIKLFNLWGHIQLPDLPLVGLVPASCRMFNPGLLLQPDGYLVCKLDWESLGIIFFPHQYIPVWIILQWDWQNFQPCPMCKQVENFISIPL